MICFSQDWLRSIGMSERDVRSICDGGGIATSPIFSFGGGGGGGGDKATLSEEPMPRTLLLVGMSDRYSNGEALGASVVEICISESGYHHAEPTTAEVNTILDALSCVENPAASLIRSALVPYTDAAGATIVNLTPHAITVGDRHLPPSGVIARAIEDVTPGPPIAGWPTSRVRYRGVEGIPVFESGCFYVVSSLARDAAAASGRVTVDLLTPGEQVRDDAGRIVGCRSLCRAR